MTDKLETGLRYGHFPLRVALPRYGQGQGHKDKRRSEEARQSQTDSQQLAQSAFFRSSPFLFWPSSGKKNKFGLFCCCIADSQAEISGTTMAHLFFFPLLGSGHKRALRGTVPDCHLFRQLLMRAAASFPAFQGLSCGCLRLSTFATIKHGTCTYRLK